jgi:polysaccharide biosynthesis/export protein
MRRSVALLALTSWMLASLQVTAAQPLPDSLTRDSQDGGGNSKIPVTMKGGTEVLGAEGAATSAPPASISLEEPIDPDKYVCGPGDVFELNFWGQQNFRLRIAADLEGRVFISKVGFVAISAKTLSAVRKEISRKVRGNYPGLNFEVVLVQPRSFLVHVVNNVKQPGSHAAHPLERVSAVLERAGGATGSRRRIAIRHKSGGETTADLVLYELTGDTSHNPYVLDGDVIDVPFAAVTVNVVGAVRRPGPYELIKTKDLAELFDLAGGLAPTVTKSLPIRITRRNTHEQAALLEVPFTGGAVPNRTLQDDDRVHVQSTEELQRSVLLIGAVVGSDSLDTATTSKRLPFVEGDTVRSLIDRAGGIRAPGDLRRSYIARPQQNAQPTLIPVDLEALLVKREFSADKPVQMGDTIVIPAMRYSVLVEGAVGRAGLYPYNPTFGIAEYVAHAGGRTRTARDIDETKLIDPNGITHSFRKDLKPAPGDAILVPERNFTRAEIVQIVLAGAGLVLSGVAIALAARQ